MNKKFSYTSNQLIEKLFYDDFLDIIPPKMRKILAVILLTIGALFIISYSIIDDDFLEIIALLIGVLLVLVGLMTFFHNSISGDTIISNENSNEVVEQNTNNSALPLPSQTPFRTIEMT